MIAIPSPFRTIDRLLGLPDPRLGGPGLVETEPIVAWRAWGLMHLGERILLRSLVGGSAWPEHEATRATCRAVRLSSAENDDPHDSPQVGCGCGVWALKRRSGLNDLYGLSEYGGYVGEVYLWGTVIEHRHGYRAEYAYPKSLYVLSPSLVLAPSLVFGRTFGRVRPSRERKASLVCDTYGIEYGGVLSSEDLARRRWWTR